MSEPVRILHLEDSAADAEVIRSILRNLAVAHDLMQVSTGAEFQRALLTRQFDLILSDFQIPGFSGRQALELVRAQRPDLPFIFVSGTIGEDAAIRILREGATDYVLKDRLGRLVPAVNRAITEAQERAAKQQAENELREKVTLLDLTHDAAIVHDEIGHIRFWNKGASRLFGWSAHETFDHLLPERIFAPETRQVWNEVTMGAVRQGHWRGELNLVAKDGCSLVVDARITSMSISSGSSMLFLATDLTQKKMIEKQLLRAQRMESIGILASGIAHDLNNVLTPILLASQMFLDRATDPELQKTLATIHASALRGADVIRQILTFARGTESEQLVVRSKHLVEELHKFLRRTFPHNISVEHNSSNDIWPVLGDPTQIHQVLLNLCVNARDAMLPQGGTLLIEVQNVEISHPIENRFGHFESGQFVCFSVSDTGTGMSPEVLAKIFDPFFTTKSPGQGTGLGLSTAFGIVKAHNGWIEVSSEPGKGSTFRVYLPASIGHPIEQPMPQSTIKNGNGELVLVVDDDAAICEMTATILRTHGYKALTAASGEEAENLFLENPGEISVMVTDSSMPGMSGLQLVQYVRAAAPNTKIILSSGTEIPAEEQIPEKVAFLHKPWTAIEFLNLLHEIIAES
jgi:two-component system, cell cycle sensor histidine kinase and response regulator CckA